MLKRLKHYYSQIRLSRRLGNRSQPGSKWSVPAHRGQALILLVVSFFALLAFIGLVTDVGAVYVSYTQLQRAVDAAAVAGANNIKFPELSAAARKQKITESAREMLIHHDITGVSTLEVYLCNDTGLPPSFAAMCPQIGQPPRKLAFIRATQDAPMYFLHLFGLQSVTLTTSAVGEAAAVDLVLVFDTSESMGINTTGYDPNNFDPSTCNAANNCQPLRQSKDAAKMLIQHLFTGFDQVAVISFDYDAQVEYALSPNIGDDDGASDGDVYDAIDNMVTLHDDAPAALLQWSNVSPNGGYRTFNPIFPDDRDGDGQDVDPGFPCVDINDNNTGSPPRDKWDDTTGEPCDRDDILDAYDWNANGDFDDDNIDPVGGTYEDTSLLSTCSGCGIRIGEDMLVNTGRPNSVWVMVFLSDGVANLSDTNLSHSEIPSQFRYGFCGADPSTAFWSSYCIDWNSGFGAGRHCIDDDAGECPPSTTPTTVSGPYSVEDYAFDMTDQAALLYSNNPNEPPGEDMAIYAIGLGSASAGETLLRYMGNIGEDNSRANDSCASVPPLSNCGNYYYAPSASYLSQIFESIAYRIFTKISR